MKRKLQLVIGSLLLVGILASCNNDISVNDQYVSIQLEEALLEDDLEAFRNLLDERYQNKEESFNELKEIAHGQDRATFKKMEIIEYENEILIVYLTVDGDKTKVTDVKVVPSEMADTVKEVLGNN